MTAALASAVELLERSLAYTRVALAEVEQVPGSASTPCHGWPLDRLLAHMEDSLDAYTEAATGRLLLASTTRGRPRLEAIQHRACDLLGWWLEHTDVPVAVADRWLVADTLVGAAALEITLHGWDLHATAGGAVPVPEALARPLLELTLTLGDRLPCAAPPVDVGTASDDSGRLLALLGRTT